MPALLKAPFSILIGNFFDQRKSSGACYTSFSTDDPQISPKHLAKRSAFKLAFAGVFCYHGSTSFASFPPTPLYFPQLVDRFVENIDFRVLTLLLIAA